MSRREHHCHGVDAAPQAGQTCHAAPSAGPGRSPGAGRAAVTGLLAAAGLLGFYLGTLTLVQGWDHALDQLLREDRWYIAAIVAGFGVQVGLFALLRQRAAHVPKAGVAASTGTSGAAMVACCAHHLTDVLPVLGVSAAAVFLNEYRTQLLWLGIAANAAGTAYLTHLLRRGRSPKVSVNPSGDPPRGSGL